MWTLGLLTILAYLYPIDATTLIQNVFSSEVFILPLSHHNFSLPFPDVNYRPSIAHMPDLPSWLQYSFSSRDQMGYIYGVPPPTTDSIQLEVIATDKETYNVQRKLFDVDIRHKEKKLHEVRFKIMNFNVEDLLVTSIRRRLFHILLEDIWPESYADLVVTSLISATDAGDHLPLNPQEREGCYISFGSNAPFSQPLKELEQEAKLLWDHHPCPKYFKKASYERVFRQKHFSVDWCSYRLYENQIAQVKEMEIPNRVSLNSKFPLFTQMDNESDIKLIKKSEVIVRSFVLDVINTILIPLLVMVISLALLTLAMCCHSTNMDLQSSNFFDELFDDFPRIPKTQEIQMVQYANVNRASEALRTFTTREHSPHLSMATTTTQADTLPRSRTDSPSSTVHRNFSLRRYEDYATLSRPDPPPYQRNGSSPAHYDS